LIKRSVLNPYWKHEALEQFVTNRLEEQKNPDYTSDAVHCYLIWIAYQIKHHDLTAFDIRAA